MTWKFDQAPNVACFTCRAVMDGQPILIVTHHADDHSWSFMDGAQIDMTTMLVVAMEEIIGRHPELQDMASLPPGWSARRTAVGEPWRKQDEFHL